MQPSTSNIGSTSFIDSYLNSTEDCRFLLRALERQAFENVVFAFCAQGPLTQYTELLLDHLKTALSIDDEEFNIKIRMASNNPHICRIAEQLNPSYDNSRWVSFAYDLSGIELAKIRKMAVFNNNPKLLSKQIRELNKHNDALPDANERLSLLMQLPKQPYVPERLRKFLRNTESTFENHIPIDKKEEVNFPPQKPIKNSVGRPRKRKRVEEEKRKEEKTMEEMLKKERKEGQLKKERREEQFEKEPEEEESTKKCHPNSRLNTKGASFAIQKSNNSIQFEEAMREFSLTKLNLPSIPASSSQHHKCQILFTKPQNELKCALSKEKQLQHFDHKVREETKKAQRRESEDTTSICARMRPFNRAIQSKTRVTDKRPTLNSLQIDLENDIHLSQRKNCHPFALNSKCYGETSVRIERCKNNFEVQRNSNKSPNESHTSVKSPVNALSTDSLPLQMATARFVAHSSHQCLTASNAVVEADHSYEKASPYLPLGSDGTNNSPIFIDKYDVPVTVNAKNGLVLSNGAIKKGTPLASHLSALPNIDIMRTNEFIANQPIFMDEEETSGLDFLASTASLLAPMEHSAVKCNDKIATTSEG